MVKMKFKNNKKQLLASLILIICLAFSGIILVYADNNSDPDKGGNPANSGGCKDAGKWCYSDLRWGVRITLIDKNGDRIGGTKTIDVWSAKPKTRGDKPLFTYPGSISSKWLKKEVVASGEANGGLSTRTFDSLGTGDSVYLLSNGSFSGSKFFELYKQYMGDMSSGDTLSTAIKKYDEYLLNLIKNNNGAEASQSINSVFDALGYSKRWDDLTPEERENLFFQFEPLIVFNQNLGSGGKSTTTQVGYGTVTEIAHISKSLLNAGNNTASSVIYYGKSGVKINELVGPYTVANGTISSYTDLLSNVGFGISHLWLKKYSTTAECTPALLSKIESKYGVGTTGYHEAIARLVAGTFKEPLPDGNGGMIETTVPMQTKDLLIYENYSTNKNPHNDGKAYCENLTTPPPPDTCSPEAVFKIDPCETGKSYFRDDSNPAYWLVCGYAYTVGTEKYSSDNTGHEAVETAYDGIVGNKEYCELFCYEEIETLFPKKVTSVKAGQTFVWGEVDGTFGKIKIKKTCSNQVYKKGQQGYRFEEWEEDFRANQKSQVQNYLEWQMNEAANSTISIHASGTCCIGNCGTSKNPKCCSRPTRYVGTKTSYSKNHTDSWLPSASGNSDPSHSASGCSYSEVYNALYVSTGGYQSAYTQAKNNETPLLNKIRQCTNNIKYVYKTIVTFVFAEPTNSAYGPNSRAWDENTWEMLMTPSAEDGYNKNNVNLSSCTTKTVYSYNCTGSGSGASCTPVPEQVLDCKQVTWDINGEYVYSYPADEFQWFSDKRDSTLVNKKKKPSGDEAYFYSIGFGLPTAFSLTDGKYEMAVAVGNLGDHGETKGEQNYNVENGHFKPITNVFGNVEINNDTISLTEDYYGFEYKCTYEVINEIFGYDCVYDNSSNKLVGESPEYCDPTKDKDSDGELNIIDVAYRLVSLLDENASLNVAFPGTDGSGRNIGANWDLPDNEIREILRGDIYEGARNEYTNVQYESLAMYEIMLDVNGIQYIRRSNRDYFNQGIDPYTSYVDENNNQKVYCKSKGADGEYKYCASEFLTDLQTSSSLNYNLMGTCLPTGMDADARAQDVLDNGCYTTYTYPTIDWKR